VLLFSGSPTGLVSEQMSFIILIKAAFGVSNLLSAMLSAGKVFQIVLNGKGKDFGTAITIIFHMCYGLSYEGRERLILG